MTLNRQQQETEDRLAALWAMHETDPDAFQKLSPSERIQAANWAKAKGIPEAQTNAVPFRPDPQLDQLLELQKKDPRAFAALRPTVRISVGRYKTEKAAHEALAKKQVSAAAGD